MVVLHTLFLYIIFINFKSLVPVRNKGICLLFVPGWILYLQPLFYFLNNLILAARPSKGGVFEDSKKAEI